MDPSIALFAALIGFAFFVARSARRSRELFRIEVRGGRWLTMEGGVPPALLAALKDVLSRAHVQSATVIAARDGELVRVTTSGLDDMLRQRVRNVVGTFPTQRIAAAPRPRLRNLGQRLGIVALAFWLDERRREQTQRQSPR